MKFWQRFNKNTFRDRYLQKKAIENAKIATETESKLLFIILSGFATGASWLCFYRALQEGPTSVVVPIDKLSILVTIIFSRVVFHEKLSKKALLGLILITVGTVIMTMI